MQVYNRFRGLEVRMLVQELITSVVMREKSFQDREIEVEHSMA